MVPGTIAFRSSFWTISLLLALKVCCTTAQSISSCPSGAYNITTAKGSQFQACPNTDLQTPSINVVNSISSLDACLQLCDGYSGCTKAVYDGDHSVCHIMGQSTNTPWVINTQFDTVRYINKVLDGSSISQCPSKVTNITNTDGSTSVICPRADFQGTTLQSIRSVANVASCAGFCIKTSSCNKAVYDHLNSICHIKSSSGNLAWVVNLKQYDTIAIIPQVALAKSSTTQKTSTTQTLTTKSSIIQSSTTQTSTSLSATIQSSTTKPSTTSSPTTQTSTTQISTTKSSTTQTSTTQSSTPSTTQISTTTSSTTQSSTTQSSTPSYKGLGSWSGVIAMPVIPAAAYVVPQAPFSSRVLMFSSWGSNDFSGPVGVTQFADYNFKTGAVSARSVTNTQHDMYGSSISLLQGGQALITGGDNAAVTTLYDVNADIFSSGSPMVTPRGFQSSVTTSSGKVFMIGGSYSGGIGGKNGEVFDPIVGAWSSLSMADASQILTTDAGGAVYEDNHAWLFGWKDGSVFQAGPSKVQHWFSLTGTTSIAGFRDPDNDAMCGVNVMYDALAGKIFSAGGSQSYTNSPAFSKAFLTTIDTPFGVPVVERLPDMNYPRGYANGVVLPDGTVLISGGQRTSLAFTDTDSVLIPELFDPVSRTYKQLAPAAVPRNYNSVALLLSDATVFTGGGGMCATTYGQSDAACNRAADHPDVEIFSPPYLFNADGTLAARPVISVLSSSTNSDGLNVKIGGTLTVTMNDASGTTFSLVRMGSVSHSINTDQRRVPLTTVVANQAQYTIQLPSDAGVLIPGYYYLFAMSKAGVPSVARTIQVHA